jgi:hypothetical protein
MGYPTVPKMQACGTAIRDHFVGQYIPLCIRVNCDCDSSKKFSSHLPWFPELLMLGTCGDDVIDSSSLSLVNAPEVSTTKGMKLA